MTAISVLVAAYNAASTLPQCLDSLCRQTLQEIEVFCIDDCSTDGTLALLNDYAARDPRIKVLRTPVNSGHAVARNLALQYITSPYVLMVDADDWLSPDALESALQVFNTYPHTDAVVLHLIYNNGVDEHEHPLPEAFSQGAALTGEEAFRLSLDGWQIHGLYVIRSAIQQAYPYDSTCRLYSDENTTFLHYLHCREVRCCEGRYYYRRHESSQTLRFSLLWFDRIEADQSLLFALRKETVAEPVLRRFEVVRWYNFLGCYRLYLRRRDEIPVADRPALLRRFATALHTFRPSRLPLRCRWKPGYWLMLSTRCFDWQQKAYVCLWERALKPLLSRRRKDVGIA